MGKERMTAFTDGVIAVIITIMVLDLKAPESADWSALSKLLPTFLSYVLSFLYVAIYWNNHHHLLAACERVSGGVLWANMHLLFWLSLIPFTTAWLAENHFEPVPTLLYGASLFAPALAYAILARTLIGVQGRESLLANALGAGVKEIASLALYGFGAAFALWAPAVSLATYVAVALLWLVPDRRIERTMTR
ncbi:putative membrane protein [Roseiarcus fermentans]|uniref:Putative membrane protein n=1 Tax=Roseiarcus fermentans TaxID=1473586 RepID=A0A366ER32_9HYPH|nr:TMEM175 family protein [Roseiarcus fermentans]RBP04140.1 putative membrane protein [Roseiarcus fermentans]